MRKLILIAAIVASSTSAFAQGAETLPLVRSCTVIAQAESGKPRLVLVDTKTGDAKTTYLQINAPTALSGDIETVTVSVTPFDAVTTATGLASNGDKPFVRVIVSDGWNGLLDRVRKGEKLNVAAGNETIELSLVGSGVAVAALERCAR